MEDEEDVSYEDGLEQLDDSDMIIQEGKIILNFVLTVSLILN
jgi:hypothetical protein